MKGHRRDQSESHTPLRQSELQSSVDNHEVRITFKSATSDTTVSNGSINQTSSFVDVPDLPGTQTTRPVERRSAKVSCLSHLFAFK